MIPKPIERVTFADVANHVTTKVRESATLDYKLDVFPPGDKGERNEFLADVVAFANAAGGDIIYGVEEEREGNKATAFPPRLNPSVNPSTRSR
jgi:predicted HTH transcriptional regulator